MPGQGAHIHISGIVQGVGFRPFVYNLATRLNLTGWVRNTSAGVDIEADGDDAVLAEFIHALSAEAPPLACIDELTVAFQPANGFQSFEILHSAAVAGAFQPISPDVAICADCLRELFDPCDRRYGYPFINCTNCGPRFTIIKDIPYDRPQTTMAGFRLCADCEREYHDPSDRRFHAQPVACPVCGPQVWLEAPNTSTLLWGEAIRHARVLLTAGSILVVKGLGGFHLACDATHSSAVMELRRRKLRVEKPFALMMPDIETVTRHCFVDEAEWELLQSGERPIVLLRRKPESNIAQAVAPGQDYLGVMLPYTPLHYLLFANPDHQPVVFDLPPLVMTSGNLSEEPIATENEAARQGLATMADAFLMHDRDIHIRCDDSVVRVVDSSHGRNTGVARVYPLRRSRGYSPFPIKLPWQVSSVLGVGAELKNTFCLTRKNYAFLSHHIGDMENYETLQSFLQGVGHFERLFRVQPEALACDLHPNYLATRYALERAERERLPVFSIQHHHAHVAACMAENGLDGDHPVIGLTFDGTGYGEDGAIWGGEVLLADYLGFQRAAHLAYFPLPGGDAAIRKPARTALALLWSLGMDWDERLAPNSDLCAQERSVLRMQLENHINTPLTSSLGRLFDAAAALAGVRQKVSYEAQAAIEFEALADPTEEGAYPFYLVRDPARQALDICLKEGMEALVSDVLSGAPVPVIAARFHNGIAEMAAAVCHLVRERSSIDEVALSGGVWQNMTLLKRTWSLLENDQFKVYIHHQSPANDGGLALGQAVIAACKLHL